MDARTLKITVLLLWCFLIISDGQTCINNPNIRISENRAISEGVHFVMLDSRFGCNGRITSVAASMFEVEPSGSLPVFQVWRPLYPGSSNYSKVGQVQFEAGLRGVRVHISNVSLIGKDQIEFRSGDVIGCYQPFNSHYRVATTSTVGTNYTSYFTRINSFDTTAINVRSISYSATQNRPLISVMIDIRCDNLPTPANGGIILCSSDRVGVGYEGDNCSFTCNAGYELTGSYTRICQSDGNWSGTDNVCRRVACSSLSTPNYGTISCSLGNDGVPSYEDTCSFTCNTGYELTGSDTRTCQSDGSWSGSDQVCRRVSCPSLSDPNDGLINCSLGDDGVLSYEDICSFTCNTGYELTVNSTTRTCQSNGNWSGIDNVCRRALNNGPAFQDDNNRSPGAAIGGAVGAILFIVIVIIIALMMFFIRQLQRRKMHSLEEAKDTAAHDYQNIDTKANQGSIKIASSSKAIYEKATSPYYSILNAALSSVDGTYEPHYEASVNWYEASGSPSQALAKSIEEEEEIYNTPYEEEGNYGPVYCEPPNDEQKIYAEFEGKKFRKLYHKEIWRFEELGTGEFGVVTYCKWKPSTNKEVEVAVKTLNSNANDKDRLRFLQEAAIMCQFDHQNVIKLHGVVTETPAMIVLEYMRHGDLQSVLKELQPMNGITAHTKLPLILLKFCYEIAAGMTYLSGKQFVHRDLAARNILVSENIVCKIADFGMSHDLTDGNYYITSGGKIPVKWTAPEAIHYRKYSVQSDTWSYGCVMYEIWSLGYKPFEELTNIEAIEKVDDGFRLPPPPGCPRTIYRVMMKCWNPEPRSRPQFGQISKLLSGNTQYLLGWSDEDKQFGGDDAMKLGAPLESAYNLYYDLQLQYKQISR